VIPLYALQSDGSCCLAVVADSDCNDLSDDPRDGLPPTYWVCSRHQKIQSSDPGLYRFGKTEGTPFLATSYTALVDGEGIAPKRFRSLDEARTYARNKKWNGSASRNP
jgi:hypothetical protein